MSMRRRLFFYLSLMLALITIFFNGYVIAAEQALIQNKTSKFSAGDNQSFSSFNHKASLKIWFENWDQPWNGDIAYTINSGVQGYVVVPNSMFGGEDDGYWEKYKVDSIKLRMYNWSFDKTKSCSNCSDIKMQYTSTPGKDRPWRLNGTHIATHKGVTCRIETFLTR